MITHLTAIQLFKHGAGLLHGSVQQTVNDKRLLLLGLYE